MDRFNLLVRIWLLSAACIGGAVMSLVNLFVFVRHGGSFPHQEMRTWLMLGAPFVTIAAGVQVLILRRRLNAQPRKGVAEIVAHLRGRGDVSMSTDAIMAHTRGED
jgi:hypothetical protein